MLRGKLFSLLVAVIACLWLIASASKVPSTGNKKIFNKFDIVIGGGSLSALAAAITAANITIQQQQLGKRGHAPLRIALLEPTDWAGGQLTSSNVPPDFGSQNHVPENLPQSFVQLLMAVAGPEWLTNPGQCWVSYKCFEAQQAAAYITEWLKSYESVLTVFYNTVIIDSSIHGGRVKEIVAVRRSTGDTGDDEAGYSNRLSDDLADWYSPLPSALFPNKEILVFSNPVAVIEGTEYADILMTSTLQSGTSKQVVSQGVETPTEDSDTTDPTCGQSTVLPFHISYHPSYPKDSDEDGQYPHPDTSITGTYSMGTLSWNEVWTYRRVYGTGSESTTSVNPNEISNQNLDNDYKDGYLFNTDDLTTWNTGGVNLTVLRAVEDRAYGWYDYLLSTANTSITSGMSSTYLSLNITQVGTKHGLAKVPYLRDTRRVKRGLNSFRLLYSHLSQSAEGSNSTLALRFNDTIGIGVYHYADIHGLHSNVCSYPSYITCCTHPVLPYYLPFRALTIENVENMLVSGKIMAQSFLANAATRLHPVEWASGVAAGVAAVGMASSTIKWDSVRDIYENHIEELQSMLQSPEVASPLEWTL